MLNKKFPNLKYLLKNIVKLPKEFAKNFPQEPNYFIFYVAFLTQSVFLLRYYFFHIFCRLKQLALDKKIHIISVL